MQTLINQILEGKFNYENRYLDFSCTKIEIALHSRGVTEGSFRIIGPEGKVNMGKVTSSDSRMECLTEEYCGSNEEILYRFHGEDMAEGECVRGSFFVVGNQGEYTLPFTVTMEPACLEAADMQIQNLNHFALLARKNRPEALKLFYTSRFRTLLTGEDAQYELVYRALSANVGSEQNLEEFLLQTGKKQRVDYMVQENILYAEDSDLSETRPVLERNIVISRNGWGYTRLAVECDGEFFFTAKELLTEDDFLGNTCTLTVFIDLTRCHRGKNFGCLKLTHSYGELEIPVEMVVDSRRATRKARLTEKNETLRLMRLYEDFRNRKLSMEEWIKETGRLVESMAARDVDDVAVKLFQAQVLITRDQPQEAGWILDQVSEQLEKGQGNDTLLAYYLYLTSLIHRDLEYVDRVTAEVENIYRQDAANWRVGWLLLYLSEEYYRSATAKWVFLEKQFSIGCSSPMLYIEALGIINNNPSILRRLGAFEQQVIWYAVRHDVLQPEVREHVIYLAEKVRDYSYVLFRTLNRMYEKSRDERLLQQICSLLVKGGRIGDKYFRFYRDGVENNLPITNLYEYYMMSLDVDKDREIPKRVLLYFSYQNNLDYEHTAYMYDYILRHKEDMRDVYETYRNRMELFCIEQITRMHFSRSLANLYNAFLQPGMLNETTAPALSRLLFAHMIRVSDRKLQKLYVYQPGKQNPEEYPIRDGCTWAPLYGSQYVLAFEDAWGNRYTKSVEYDLEKAMFPGKYLQELQDYAVDNPSLDIFLLEGVADRPLKNSSEVDRALRVISSGQATDQFRHGLLLKVLLFYYEQDAYTDMDRFLETIPVEELDGAGRNEVMQYLILREKYEPAEQLLRKYGPYRLETKLLLRLLDYCCDNVDMTRDPTLLDAAMCAFRKGRVDSTVLYYLILHSSCNTKEYRDLRKLAVSYQLDCFAVCERMLLQMLYTGAFIHEKDEVFAYYVDNGGDPLVVELYLEYSSYDYYLRDRLPDFRVIEEIRKMYLDGQPIQRICKLAYLKYFAYAAEDMTPEHRELTEKFLSEMMNQGIHLEFFREFTWNEQVQQEMVDKVILTFRGEEDAKAVVHYALVDENENQTAYIPGERGDLEYTAEYMTEVASGIFCKEFILFYGEGLHYYITQELPGKAQDAESEEQIMEDGVLHSAFFQDGRNRFRLVNEIVAANEIGDYDKMDQLLERYYKREFLNSRLFTLK